MAVLLLVQPRYLKHIPRQHEYHSPLLLRDVQCNDGQVVTAKCYFGNKVWMLLPKLSKRMTVEVTGVARAPSRRPSYQTRNAE